MTLRPQSRDEFIITRFMAGVSIDLLARELEIPVEEVERVVRQRARDIVREHDRRRR